MANSSEGKINAASSSDFLTKRPPRSLYGWMNQNFLVIWMKSNVDTGNDNAWLNTIQKLQEIVNVVYTFTDADEGIDFISEIKEKKVFLVLSDVFRETIIPVVHDIEQVHVIYLFCENRTQHEQWTKVKNVFADMTVICEELKQAVQECDQNSVSISLIPMSAQDSSQSLDQLDQSFMYTLLLKEILMTIEFNKEHVNDLTTYYREQSIGNNIELKYVEELKTEYFHHQPIWWYTYNYFLYSMVNRSLRTMEVDLVIKMGFFVRDLYQNIVQLHEQQNTDCRETLLTVYRGQGLPQTDFERLRRTKDGLISFNNFLSTSCDRDVSLAFAESNQLNSNLIGVLFQIDIDPSITSTPFADISDLSHYRIEKEYLFSMHSVFRIGQIEQIGTNSRLWQVNLMLTSDRDPQLHAVTERLREETLPLEKGWFRLGNLLFIIGQFDKAQRLFEIILDQTSDDLEMANVYHMLGMIKKEKGEYAEAVTFSQKAIEIKQKKLFPIHPHLLASYTTIGSVYIKMGEYAKALSFFEKELEIYQQILPSNDIQLATSNSYIGGIYGITGDYTKALSHHEKALEIYRKTLPPDHPTMAGAYGNIGFVYNHMHQYSKALPFYAKSCEIREKILPSNHPELAVSYNNIGLLYGNIDELSKALSYHEKALEISLRNFSSDHLHLAASYSNIAMVYEKMGQYQKAFLSEEKALEIYQKNLPANHLDLAACYSSMSSICAAMGHYSKAMSFQEKALDIRQNILPSNHPDLASSYSGIARVYYNMGQYAKALSFIERAIAIAQQSLPEDHLDLQEYMTGLVMIKRKL